MDQKFSGPTPLTVHPPTQRRSNSFSGERLRAFSSTFCDICHPIIPISLSPRREQHPPSPPQTPLTITTPQQDDKLCIFCELSHDVPAISSAVYPIMNSNFKSGNAYARHYIPLCIYQYICSSTVQFWGACAVYCSTKAVLYTFQLQYISEESIALFLQNHFAIILTIFVTTAITIYFTDCVLHNKGNDSTLLCIKSHII